MIQYSRLFWRVDLKLKSNSHSSVLILDLDLFFDPVQEVLAILALVQLVSCVCTLKAVAQIPCLQQKGGFQIVADLLVSAFPHQKVAVLGPYIIELGIWVVDLEVASYEILFRLDVHFFQFSELLFGVVIVLSEPFCDVYQLVVDQEGVFELTLLEKLSSLFFFLFEDLFLGIKSLPIHVIDPLQVNFVVTAVVREVSGLVEFWICYFEPWGLVKFHCQDCLSEGKTHWLLCFDG